MKVLIVVTHLLGTGHLSRALTLGRAFSDAGHGVTLVSGGFPAPQLNATDLDLRQLSPVRSDGTNFTRLLTSDDREADMTYLAERSKQLTDILFEVQPDVLITELFPFGRRILRQEFLTLLTAARGMTPCPLTLCSIRDILAPPSRLEKVTKTDAVISEHYDAVLVHSDPHTTPLEASWPVSDSLSEKIRYTGYVAPGIAAPHPKNAGHNEILVSAGGGTVGTPIFRAAIEAARKITNRHWRLLVGGSNSNERILKLRQSDLPENVTIEPTRPDFRQMLHHADASVSMCGYNTALDVLQSGTPTVFIPFDDGQEVEQTLRAESLADLAAIQIVPSASLSADSLAEAVSKVIAEGPRTGFSAQFDGSRESVRIVEDMSMERA